MTRSVNRGAIDGSPRSGCAGLSGPRPALPACAATGVHQHAMDDLTNPAQVERLQDVRSAVPFEKLALLPPEDVSGEEDNSMAQSRKPMLEHSVETHAVEDRHIGVAEDQAE